MRIYALLKTLEKYEQYSVSVFISDNRFAPCQGLCCTCRLGAQNTLLCKTAENMESITHMLGEVEMGVQRTTGLIGIIKVMAWNVRWEWEFIICVFSHVRQWCLDNVNLGEDFLFSKPVLCFLSNPPFPQHTFFKESLSMSFAANTTLLGRYQGLCTRLSSAYPGTREAPWWMPRLGISFTIFNPIC